MKQSNDFILHENAIEDVCARYIELETLACELKDVLKAAQVNIAKCAREGFTVEESLMKLFETNQVTSNVLKKAEGLL